METFSKDFRKVFLFAFTKELIRNSVKDDIIKLQEIFELGEKEGQIINQEEKEKPIINLQKEQEPIFEQSILSTEKIKKVERPIQIKQIAKNPPIKPVPKQITRIEPRSHLFIPELKLPPHLEYLKPIPKPGIDIDLTKLNPVIKDPAVRLIEVNPDERVIVTGTMGTKPTEIILSKEDIDRVINKFSEASKIPTNEGIYRVVAGNLILSAIISGVIGSKFVIKKMAYPNPSNMQRYPSFPGGYS
jgi:hypothetical protein